MFFKKGGATYGWTSPTTFIFLWVEVLKTNIEKHHHPIAKIYKFSKFVYITFNIFNLVFKNQIMLVTI